MSRQGLLLAVLAAGLAGLVVYELGPADEGGMPLRRTAPQAAAAPSATAPDRVPQWVAASLARPLFSPDRRPPAPGPAAAAGPETPLPRLSGTMVSPAGRSAIFAGPDRPLVLREGDRLGALVIDRIEPGQVILAGRDGIHTLRPGFDPGRQASAAVPSVPAAPGIRQPQRTALAGAPPFAPPFGPAAAGAFGEASAEQADQPEGAAPSVPFEQNPAPSGLDILRNLRRANSPAAPAPATGAPR